MKISGYLFSLLRGETVIAIKRIECSAADRVQAVNSFFAKVPLDCRVECCPIYGEGA